ncbi:MAG TPA: hypothetical protein VM283_04025, partial [Armatimonadota bacterium]|nr:hypothetical protein [Armatimonadota bacterium]
ADGLEISPDGVCFETVPVSDGVAMLRGVDLSSRRLGFFVRGAKLAEVILDIPREGPNRGDRGHAKRGHGGTLSGPQNGTARGSGGYWFARAGSSRPFGSPRFGPSRRLFERARREALLFGAYVRDTKVGEREVLGRWDEFHPMLMAEGFGVRELREMFGALLEWCRRRQMTDEGDAHLGAIYSEENKYDFRDAAAAAVAFTYAGRDSGDDRWLERARMARRYVYKGQHTEGQRRGGWAHMVSGKWGGDLQTQYTRITQPMPGVDGVDTAIIINLLCRAAELGLEPDDDDLRHIRLGAEWVARSELRPGVFAHHEGAEHDCQNSNALGAMALSRAHETLTHHGRQAPDEWLGAARRGMAHFIEGQEAIGVWPYVFATIGRGQAFHWQNLPDQGMGCYHFLVGCATEGLRGAFDVAEILKRAARWYLCMCRIDESWPRPTIDLDYQREGGGLLFSSFTWCRFMAAACLARIASVTGEREPWRHLALRLMEHVREKLWNETDADRSPVVRSARPDIELHSWIAAAEWEAVLVRDIIEHLEGTP